jgi:hypothetical protein
MWRRRAGLFLPTAALVLAAGCAALQRSAGQEPPVDPDAITVEVRNKLTPPTALTVYVVTEAGTRSRLGVVTGSTTGRFVVNVPPLGQVRFYARTSEGGDVASNPVTLRQRQILEWDVFANIVSQRFGGEAPDEPVTTSLPFPR